MEESMKKLCEALWLEYEPTLRRTCEAKLYGYQSEVEDIVSQTYLDFCIALEKRVEIKNPKAWLFGALNKHIAHVYREAKAGKRPLPMELENMEILASYEKQAEDHLYSDEDIERLKHEVVDDLKDRDRELYTYLYEKNLKFPEISKITGDSEKAIRQRKYRLHIHLKKLSRKKMDEHERKKVRGF